MSSPKMIDMYVKMVHFLLLNIYIKINTYHENVTICNHTCMYKKNWLNNITIVNILVKCSLCDVDDDIIDMKRVFWVSIYITQYNAKNYQEGLKLYNVSILL